MQLFGYATQIANAGEQLSTTGERARSRASATRCSAPTGGAPTPPRAVEVSQLAAFHTPGQRRDAQVALPQGSITTTNTLHPRRRRRAVHPAAPRRLGSRSRPARSSPSTQGGDTNPAFGFRIDNEWSDPTQEPAGAGRRRLRAPRPLLGRQGPGRQRHPQHVHDGDGLLRHQLRLPGQRLPGQQHQARSRPRRRRPARPRRASRRRHRARTGTTTPRPTSPATTSTAARPPASRRQRATS